jgi:FkbH-like protein
MRLALLSNVTVDLLAGMVKKTNDVYLSAGFDTWQQEMIMPTSGLYEYKPEAVVVLLHAGAYEWEDRDTGCQMIDEWCAAFKSVTNNLPGVPVFVSSLDIPAKVHYGAEISNEGELENHLIKRIEELHADGASIYILPVKEAIADHGRNSFYSSKMWYVGSMPYSMKGMSALNELISRYTGITKGMHKKCIAVDLDNTLWGGVIGEDGVEGIVLSNHKEGARYYDTQKLLKKMKNQGVMLAILSKNNVEDVEPVFKHPDMVLQHEDFVAEVINWQPKSQNIRQLAKDLNIGLDSFVFLDDNPAEREAMKAECPEVTVIDFPKDSSLLPETVEKAYQDYFLSLEVTGEDTKKTAMYRAESQRKAEMNSATSVEDFLKKLEMTMDIHRMLPEEEKRVVQLVNKTNQFNVTTKRYSEEEIKELADKGDVITVHMADKYGDQGLVAVLILKYDGDQADIDTFLMSCRVMGRNTENEIVARIKNLLQSKGVKSVHAAYIKTAKNAPVESLFEKLGFSITEQEEGHKEYSASIDELPATTGVFKDVAEVWE